MSSRAWALAATMLLMLTLGGLTGLLFGTSHDKRVVVFKVASPGETTVKDVNTDVLTRQVRELRDAVQNLENFMIQPLIPLIRDTDIIETEKRSDLEIPDDMPLGHLVTLKNHPLLRERGEFSFALHKVYSRDPAAWYNMGLMDFFKVYSAIAEASALGLKPTEHRVYLKPPPPIVEYVRNFWDTPFFTSPRLDCVDSVTKECSPKSLWTRAHKLLSPTVWDVVRQLAIYQQFHDWETQKLYLPQLDHLIEEQDLSQGIMYIAVVAPPNPKDKLGQNLMAARSWGINMLWLGLPHILAVPLPDEYDTFKKQGLNVMLADELAMLLPTCSSDAVSGVTVLLTLEILKRGYTVVTTDVSTVHYKPYPDKLRNCSFAASSDRTKDEMLWPMPSLSLYYAYFSDVSLFTHLHRQTFLEVTEGQFRWFCNAKHVFRQWVQERGDDFFHTYHFESFRNSVSPLNPNNVFLACGLGHKHFRSPEYVNGVEAWGLDDDLVAMTFDRISPEERFKMRAQMGQNGVPWIEQVNSLNRLQAEIVKSAQPEAVFTQEPEAEGNSAETQSGS